MKKKKDNRLQEGQFVDVEDGWLVLYDIDRNEGRGWGVIRVDRVPTTIRAATSNIDLDLFPLKVERSHDGIVMLMPRAGMAPLRHTIKEAQLRRDRATREKIVLGEDDLSEYEASRRWNHILLSLRDSGRLVEIAANKRLPKKAKEIFSVYAQELSANFDSDAAYDAIYDKFGFEAANDFTAATRIFSGNSSGSDRVFVLVGKGGGHTPVAVHGNLPEIDWAKLPV